MKRTPEILTQREIQEEQKRNFVEQREARRRDDANRIRTTDDTE